MPLADADLANMALAHLGATTITSLTENSTEARTARLFFDTARQAVLRDFAWPFATKRATPGLVTDWTAQTDVVSEWQYDYRYPSDALRLLRIESGTGSRRVHGDVLPRHTVMADSTGQLLRADTEDAVLHYVADVPVSSFSPDAALAMSFLLASLIAPKLTGGDPTQLGERALQKYDAFMQRAWANALNEQSTSDEPISGFEAARQ